MRKTFLMAMLWMVSHSYAQNTIDKDNEYSDKIPHGKTDSPSFYAKDFTHIDARLLTVASENFNVNFYRCEWEVDPAVRYISGKVTSYFTITVSTSSIVYDLSAALMIDSIIYHKQKVAYSRTANDGLEILFPETLPFQQRDSVAIFYQGEPRPIGSAFFKTAHNGVPVISTLSEPYGAKEWWPCKNGLNDKADSIDIVITNPAVFTAATNGVMVNELVTGNKKITYWKHRYAISSYLVAIAISNYVVLKDSVQIGNVNMPVIDYAYPENENDFRALAYYTKYALQFFSKLFGDYPFLKEKYGHTQFSWGGGMEHQTNTFMARAGTSLMAHELAHQWFGDKITCGSWRDIWLNEGFATYVQLLYDESLRSGYLLQALKNMTNTITPIPGGSVWVNDTTVDSRIFNGRLSYSKGSYLLHMLRWKLGDSVFFRGIRQYANDPRIIYNFALTNDLQRNLEEVSGKNLSSFFEKWFKGEGHPSYHVQWAQDTFNLAYVKISQSTSHPSVTFYDMPVPIQFKNATRDTVIVFTNIQNGEAFLTNPGFVADSVVFDPFYMILSGRNAPAKIECSSVSVAEKLPFYNIEWTQNINNWVNLNVWQTNNNADALAETTPVFVHFTANGKDTGIAIKNIHLGSGNWINIGFKAETAFVTSPSCFMKNAHSIQMRTTGTVENDIKIFPNPATDHVSIVLKNPTGKNLNIHIFNTAGQLVYQRKVETNGRDESIDIPTSTLLKGVYLVRLTSEKKIMMVKKILK